MRSKRNKLPGLPVGDPRHGTPNGYNNCGCRCPRCTRSWTRFCREKGYVAKRRRRIQGTPCSVYGCSRVVALSNPGHGLCAHHLEEDKARVRAGAARRPRRTPVELLGA